MTKEEKTKSLDEESLELEKIEKIVIDTNVFMRLDSLTKLESLIISNEIKTCNTIYYFG